MSTRIRILGAAVAMTVAGVALPVAQAAPAPLAITTLKPDTSTTVSLKTLREVRFEIPSNATTGYHYEVTVPKNTAKSKVSKLKYVAPTTGLMGSGGTAVLTVAPKQAGSTVVKWTLIAPGGAVSSTSTVTLSFKQG